MSKDKNTKSKGVKKEAAMSLKEKRAVKAGKKADKNKRSEL